MQFQDYRSISVSSVLWKKQTFGNSDITLVSVDRISLATLQFVQQIMPEYKKKKKKDTMFHSTDPPSGEKSLVNNGISTQRVRIAKILYHAIQGLPVYIYVIILERQVMHNSDNNWANWDFILLAGILSVQQLYHITDPSWGESIGDQWTRLTKGQQSD